MILHYFIYLNRASYITIHTCLIRKTKKLSYSQTWKLGSPDLKLGQLLHPNSYEIYSTSWWFSTTLCIQIQLIKSRFILVWLERRRSCNILKQENWDHLIWKWDNLFIITPVRFIQLAGDSPRLYVYKYNFLHCDSFMFDSNDKEVVIFPNKETGISWFEIEITSSS